VSVLRVDKLAQWAEPIRSFREIVSRARQIPARLGVIWPHDTETIKAAADCIELGLCDAVFYGQEHIIRETAGQAGIQSDAFKIYECPGCNEAVKRGIAAARSGKINILMKGLIETAVLFKEILTSGAALSRQGLLSQVGVFEFPSQNRLVVLSDAGINICPTLKEKALIVNNAVTVAGALGMDCPKVAMLAALEKVNEKMPCTVEAAIIAKMAERGQIKGCVIDGPLALDNALLPNAAATKGLSGPVAGMADVLVVPDIEAGDVLYKAISDLACFPTGSVVVGGSIPMVVPSRADSSETKRNSVALGILLTGEIREWAHD